MGSILEGVGHQNKVQSASKTYKICFWPSHTFSSKTSTCLSSSSRTPPISASQPPVSRLYSASTSFCSLTWSRSERGLNKKQIAKQIISFRRRGSDPKPWHVDNARPVCLLAHDLLTRNPKILSSHPPSFVYLIGLGGTREA